MLIDLNAILSAAVSAAIAEAVKPLQEQIVALKTQVAEGGAGLDTTSITFVGAVEAIASRVAGEAVAEAMEDHANEYDHDEFVTESSVDDKVADAIEDMDIDDKVRDAVNGLTFEVCVS